MYITPFKLKLLLIIVLFKLHISQLLLILYACVEGERCVRCTDVPVVLEFNLEESNVTIRAIHYAMNIWRCHVTAFLNGRSGTSSRGRPNFDWL
jgi:hypothetical protein